MKNPEDLEWSSGPPQDISSQRLAPRQFACAHEMVSTWRVTSRLHPRNTGLQRSTISVGQVCDRGNTITFRSTGGTILNEFTGNRIDFERAGCVYRQRAGTSAKMQSGPGEVKVLKGFEQDTAGAVEAQPARPGVVLVLPSESQVEQLESTHLPFRSWCRHCARAQGKESPHHESSLGCVSKFATACSVVRMERQSPQYLVVTG